MSAGAIYDAAPVARQQKPAGAGRRVAWGRSLPMPSESDAHRALERIDVALEIVRGHPMAPGVFDAEVDKRDRAPDQVGMRCAQQLVALARRQVGVYVIVDRTRLERRAEVFGPPVLVPDPAVRRSGRLRAHHPVIGPAGGRAGRVPLRVGQRVDKAETRHIEVGAEICVDAEAVGKLACHLGAGADATAETVLAHGTRYAAERVDVAAERAAIADKALIEELPVIELIVAHHDPDLEMTPGVVDAGGADHLGV